MDLDKKNVSTIFFPSAQATKKRTFFCSFPKPLTSIRLISPFGLSPFSVLGSGGGGGGGGGGGAWFGLGCAPGAGGGGGEGAI